MTKIEDFLQDIEKYVKERYKDSGNPQYFNDRSCKKDFKAGIEFLLKLGYKSPKEVKKLLAKENSKTSSYMYDFMQDKW